MGCIHAHPLPKGKKSVSTESRRTRHSLALLLAACACPLVLAPAASATITVGGDAGEVSPADPATWTSSTAGNIGMNAGKTGNLTLDGGSVMSDLTGCIAYGADSIGSVTVTGIGSAWRNSDALTVGYLGTGTLTISGGGAVGSADGSIGRWGASVGSVTVTGTGSAWTSSGMVVVGGSNARSTLTIEKGGSVSSVLGYVAGGTAVSYATVRGAGSSWTTSSSMCVGQYGAGTLTIADGGRVSSGEGVMGIFSQPTFGSGVGHATVTGAGSTWTNEYQLLVGYDGTANLVIANGGRVTAQSLSVNSTSSIDLHVSGSNMLVLGTAAAVGSAVNGGKINLYADSALAAGIYSPISDVNNRTLIWSGSGSCNAFGGTWNNTAKTFTVAAPTLVAAGTAHTITAGERLTITDAGGAHHVGTSFGTVPGGSIFAASPMTAEELSSLTLPAGQSVVSAWDFTTDLAGSTVLLCFDVGPDASGLQAWHYSGGVWSPLTTDITYANGIASFAVSSFSGYAVTAAVPEPTALSLIALAGVTLLRRQPRRETW